MDLATFEGEDVVITTVSGKKYTGWVCYFCPADECDDGKNYLDVELEDGRIGRFDESNILSVEIIPSGGK